MIYYSEELIMYVLLLLVACSTVYALGPNLDWQPAKDLWKKFIDKVKDEL